ncbi:MAG: penicillin-binding protein activator [Methylobacter sp.]
MQPKNKPPFLRALLPGLMFFSGCTATLANNPPPEQDALVTQPLITNDRPDQIIELYQPPSSPSFAEQNQQRLQNIESLLQRGDSNEAKLSADAINPSDLSFEQRAWLALLHAQILLSFGEAEQAIENLARIRPQQLNIDNRIKYFQSQAFAHSLTGDLLGSAKSRIELHKLITSTDELKKNQAAILEALRLLPDSDLQTDGADTLAGWLSLAYILKYINQPDFNDRINRWHATFPTHPADISFLDDAPDASPNNSSTTRTIAVLLPGSGSLAQAGKAIRAGFMAAYNHAQNPTKPVIHFYDTQQSTPQALYNQAIAEGAQLIVGPLDKEQIQVLADTVDFNVPVLALNHILNLQRSRLYQFSLSPLDDSEQLTEKAREDGHKHALLLIPDNAAGKRVANYLTEDWQNQGGTILETQTYNPKETDFSIPIRKLLNLDESEQRYNKLQGLIPGLKYTPRKRQDADVIFLSAYSAEARAINPQLQFYQAGDLPVYALPNVYTGQVNASLDSDLNKITFCDTPWLFDTVYQGELSMDALKDAWKQFPSAYLRLVAMGIDAYHLATHLPDIETGSYAGATGNLSLTADQRIQRKLACARFNNGQPEVIGPVY